MLTDMCPFWIGHVWRLRDVSTLWFTENVSLCFDSEAQIITFDLWTSGQSFGQDADLLDPVWAGGGLVSRTVQPLTPEPRRPGLQVRHTPGQASSRSRVSPSR